MTLKELFYWSVYLNSEFAFLEFIFGHYSVFIYRHFLYIQLLRLLLVTFQTFNLKHLSKNSLRTLIKLKQAKIKNRITRANENEHQYDCVKI